MFEYLLIQNFQPHEKLRIDFAPDITTIVGETDAGKSSIVRALRWVCTNQPAGDAFIRWNTKGTTVKLGVDGHVITRRRSANGKVNEYQLDDQIYEAFKRGVPEPIERLLNLGPVCWQRQHDAPYWFSDTAGEVSRQLNTIVNLGIIDTSLTAVGKAVHRARTKLEIAEEGLTEAKREHDALAWVKGFEADVLVVEQTEARCITAANNAATAAGLIGLAHIHQTTHQSATTATLAGETVTRAGNRALNSRWRADTLGELVGKAEKYTKASWAVPPTGAMEDALNQHKKTASKAEAMRSLIKNIQSKETELCQLEKSFQSAKAAVPKVCPTCGASLSATSISKHAHR